MGIFNSSSSDTLGWKLRMAALHRKRTGRARQGGRKQIVGKEAEEKILKSLVYVQKQESSPQRKACSRDCSSNSRLIFGR